MDRACSWLHFKSSLAVSVGQECGCGVCVCGGWGLLSIQGSHGSFPAAVYDDSLDPFCFCHVLYPKEVPRLGSCPSCDGAEMGASMSQGRLSHEERNAILKRVPALMKLYQHCVHRLL